MNLYRLIVHSQQVKETRAKRRIRRAKRSRSFDGGSSKGRLDIQANPRFMKRSYNKVPINLPKPLNDGMLNPKSQNGRGTISPRKKPTYGKCHKKHYQDCLRTENFFGCCKSGHKIRDCPNMNGKGHGSCQAQSSGSNVDPPKKNLFMHFAQ